MNTLLGCTDDRGMQAMMKTSSVKLLLALLMGLVPAQLHAGQGTIKETDDEIFVEYYGSPGETVKEGGAVVPPAVPSLPAYVPVSTPPAAQAPTETQPPPKVSVPATRTTVRRPASRIQRRSDGEVNEE